MKTQATVQVAYGRKEISDGEQNITNISRAIHAAFTKTYNLARAGMLIEDSSQFKSDGSDTI